jgi:hypothetical protein
MYRSRMLSTLRVPCRGSCHRVGSATGSVWMGACWIPSRSVRSPGSPICSSLPEVRPLTRAAPSLWWHAQSIVMGDLSRHTLEGWDGPPLVVIRPDLRQVHSLRGGDPRKLIRAGYKGVWKALSRWDGFVTEPGGVH